MAPEQISPLYLLPLLPKQMDGIKGRGHTLHIREGQTTLTEELDGKTKRAGKPGNTDRTSKALEDLEVIGADPGLQSLEWTGWHSSCFLFVFLYVLLGKAEWIH